VIDEADEMTSGALLGLGRFYCRECKDEDGQYISMLDDKKQCPRCQRKSSRPKYIGKIFHDFRRTAAHEMWKAGNTIEDCMEVTGHATSAMFKRYADLFSEDESGRVNVKCSSAEGSGENRNRTTCA
jgi:integrase